MAERPPLLKAFATIACALALAGAPAAHGQSAQVPSPDPQVEARLKNLAQELRCLVCQNQTIADSNAPLAVDLREQIRAQIAQGRSDGEIRNYMVDRYGDFVLYRPPLKATTVLLWAAPLLLILLGGWIFFGLLRARRNAPAAELPTGKRREIESLLEETGEPGPEPAPGKPKSGGTGRR